MIIKVKKTKPEATLPQFNHPGDAGFDIFATEDYVLAPGEYHTFDVGIVSEIPEGYFLRIMDKSGLAAKAGIHTMAGVIDAGYRGEWGIVLVNLSKEAHQFNKGDKIAQGVILEMQNIEIVEINEDFSSTARGGRGLGEMNR